MKKQTDDGLGDKWLRRLLRRVKLNAVRHNLFGWVLLLFAAMFLSVDGLAGTADLSKYFENDPNDPWRVNADKMTYDKATDQTTATGNAVIQKQALRLSADEVRYNRSSLKGEAVGNVTVTAGEDRLTGERMELDLSNSTGTLHNGTLFLKENNFHVTGKMIQKTSENKYTAQDVRISTCDGDSPDWAITGKALDVTVDGYGFIHHAAFRVKDVPVFYTPFFIFPAKVKRQSGLLIPQFGTSDRKGAEFIQPFFWAINDHSDATAYAHYMGRRGVKLGAEYRYFLDQKSFGTVMFDGFKDQETDDGTGTTSEDYGYEDDTALRPNADRYWFRMKHDQALPYEVMARLDLDIVSDQDYLHEFRSGYTGFEDSDDYFEKYFGRDLDDYTDPVRTNRLNFSRLWPHVSMNAEFRWLDDVVARRQNADDDTVQRLPSISLDTTRICVFGSPFFVGLESEYAYFYREDGTRGHRTDISPRIYLPYRFGAYVSLEPSAGFRETIWHLDRFDGFAGDTDRTQHREYYDFRLDISTEVQRVYDIGADWADRLKHLMRFQAVYDYIPKSGQDEYPEFDAVDRIENKDLITYSWTHTFVSRSMFPPTHAESSSPDTEVFDYRQLARFKLEQSYNLYKERKDLPEPFSPISAELELALRPGVTLQADAGFSTYSSNFVSHNLACRLFDRRGDEFFIERRYTKAERETIYMDLIVKATPWLWFYGNFERNLFAGKDLDKGVGVSFKARCWSFNIEYAKEDDNEKVAFTISLYGLGEIGSGRRTTETSRFFDRLDADETYNLN